MERLIVYKVTHKESGRTYIGATSKSIDDRKKDHEQKASKEIGSKFQEAIGTYSPEAFTWEQIDTANNPNELAEKEKQYILKYSSKGEGYNSDIGGGIKKSVYQYDIEGNFIAEYDCLENASSAVNAYKTCVGNACVGQNKTCKGYYWSYILFDKYPINMDARKKKVLQLELDGEIVGEYNSVSEANEVTGISKTCISRVCRGEREQTGGYIFKYV
ncbi:NUMOD1 domain-containing DNA-binding protein [Galbibacter sp. PAP.153]|uniref:NUMOD1 domain-containing DNA-binding protein n=1 Tax=Galbibacter sp. PAP.153 TaxID=3104623 RepID=UPI00300B2A72